MKKRLTEKEIEEYVSLHPELEIKKYNDGIYVHWKHGGLVYVDCCLYPNNLVIARYVPIFNSSRFFASSVYKQNLRCWRMFVGRGKSVEWRYNIEKEGIRSVEVPDRLGHLIGGNKFLTNK